MDDGEGGGPRRPAGTPEVLQAGERRIARVESLRGLAALGVAIGHAWGVAHGYGAGTRESYLDRIVFGGGFGVFLFFALSGYLLFWPFVRRDLGGGARVDLGTYARNRALRILPLYFFAVVVLLVLQERGGTAEQWWRFLLLLENFDASTIATVDGVLWSVVVEIHFYALLPLLAWGLARFARGSARRVTVALVALGAVSLAIWILKVARADSLAPLWRYNLPATFFYFVPGMLLAVLRLHVERTRPAWLRGPAGSSGLWLAGSVAVWLVVFYRYDLGPLSTVAAFLCIGACVLPLRQGAGVRALDARPLVAIGVVSYSLYVWHTRVLEHVHGRGPLPDAPVALFLITLPIAIAVAFVSYRFVEAPFLRLRRRWSEASAPMEPPAPRVAPAPSPAPSG